MPLTSPPRPDQPPRSEGVDAFFAACASLGTAVIRDPDLTISQAVDWTRRWQGSTPGVLRPDGVLNPRVLLPRAPDLA